MCQNIWAHSTVTIKKYTVFHLHAIKAYGERIIAPLIHKLGTEPRLVVNATPRLLYPFLPLPLPREEPRVRINPYSANVVNIVSS